MIEIETTTLFVCAVVLLFLGALILFAVLSVWIFRGLWSLVVGHVIRALAGAAKRETDVRLRPPIRRAVNGSGPPQALSEADEPVVDVKDFEH